MFEKQQKETQTIIWRFNKGWKLWLIVDIT